MQIVVKVPMAGKTFEIDIDSDDTIKSIKELIEDGKTCCGSRIGSFLTGS